MISVMYLISRDGLVIVAMQHWSQLAGAFTIFHTKFQKKGLLEEFWRLFGFFLYGMSQAQFDHSLPLLISILVGSGWQEKRIFVQY
jgi:hypothetical protein